MISSARITALGTYVPTNILTNQDLEKLVETNDEWITQRTGMKERRIASEDEYTSNLAIKAVKQLVQNSAVSLIDVEQIIVATTTPDYAFPSVASQVQAHFSIPATGAFDLNATCAGFAYALHLANGLVSANLHKKVLVIAAETLSKVTDYTDRSTAILFGDGAAAVIVEKDESTPSFLATQMGTKGDGGKHVYRTNLSSTMFNEPLSESGKMVQNGREVYKWVTRMLPENMKAIVDKAGLTFDDIDWFVPHSANLRMVESVCEKAGFPAEKMLTSTEAYGNTSAVSIPLSLDIALKKGKLQNGQKLLIYGFGGGLTHLGHVIEWNLN